MIAVCLINGEDVGERFVRSGFGVTIPAETDRYEAAQAEARASGVGLWQGVFTPPAVWRALPMRPPSLRPRFVPN
jgi:endonuclease YncB( thermonuclease family)